MSAQDEFILYDLRGCIVSFWTVSISKASNSWSNTWHKSITMDSWTFCHKWARNIWMREIFSVGILPCMNIPVKSSCTYKNNVDMKITILFSKLCSIISTGSPRLTSFRLTSFRVTSNNVLTLFLKHTSNVSTSGKGEFTCREVNVWGAGRAQCRRAG